MKKLKQIPRFKNGNEEFEFWSIHDSTEYVDWEKAKKVIFSNLKPTSRAVSVRFSNSLLERLKFLANKKDIPYQSLIKVFVNQGVERELHNR